MKFLHRSGNLTGTQAASACVNALRSAVDDSLNTLDVGLPGTIRTPVRVGHSNAERNVLAAEFTLCHIRTSLEIGGLFVSNNPNYNRPAAKKQVFFEKNCVFSANRL